MKNDGLVHKIGPIRGWNRKTRFVDGTGKMMDLSTK